LIVVDNGAGEGEQGHMDVDLQARDGADVQMGDAHGGELGVDGLDSQAEGVQVTALSERVGGHIVLVSSEANSSEIHFD